MGTFGLGPLIGEALGAYGDKPKVPKFIPIDTTEAQGQAIAGNIKNLPEAQSLASKVNQFNQDEYNKMIDFALPGGREQITSNIASLLRGELPDDVKSQVERNSAERAIAGGFFGSDFASNLTARDLGLTSLALTQQGLNSAERWLASAKAPTFNVSSMFISPMQKIGVDVQQREFKFQRDWLKNQIKAMPDPFSAALASDLGSSLNDVFSAAGSYYGAAGGGGGGGGSL